MASNASIRHTFDKAHILTGQVPDFGRLHGDRKINAPRIPGRWPGRLHNAKAAGSTDHQNVRQPGPNGCAQSGAQN